MISFLEFEFAVNSRQIEEVEQQARINLIKLGQKFRDIDESLSKAKISEFALECTITLIDNKIPASPVNGYYTLSLPTNDLNCKKILEIQEQQRN